MTAAKGEVKEKLVSNSSAMILCTLIPFTILKLTLDT